MRSTLLFLLALLVFSPATFAQQGEPCAPPGAEVAWNGSALTTTESFDGYQWYVNGDAIDGAISRDYVPAEAGDYQVIVSRRSAEFEFTPTSRGGERSSDFRLYPNPATNQVTLQLANGPEGILRIVNVQGRTVLTRNIEAGAQNLNVSIEDFNTGIYYLQLERGDRRLVETLRVE